MPDAGRVRAAGATARHQPLRCADARAQAQRRQVFRNRGRPGAGLALCRPRIYSNRNPGDRKSTRLNSSHLVISYAVFCLKKKNKLTYTITSQTRLLKSHTTTV